VPVKTSRPRPHQAPSGTDTSYAERVATRVLLVGDEPLARLGLRTMLESASDLIRVAAEACCDAEALIAARTLCPDVAVVDTRAVSARDVSISYRFIRELSGVGDGGRLKVLVLCGDLAAEGLYFVRHGGASGVVSADVPTSQIVAAVEATARGQAWLDPGVARVVLEELTRGPEGGLLSAGELNGLTRREREILLFMAQGLSNAEIAERFVIAVGTVKTHVSRVLMKLGLQRRSQAVALAYRIGLAHITGSGPVKGGRSQVSIATAGEGVPPNPGAQAAQDTGPDRLRAAG
jgi:DNA-binding NarL/FixJ family response regulator